MTSRGYVRGPDNAMKELEKSEEAVSIAAAERAAQDRWMSDRAKVEANDVDITTIQHLGEIPATPIHNKGWPKGKPRKQVPGRET